MSEHIVCPYCHNPLSQSEYVKVVRCRDCDYFDENYLKCHRPVMYFDHDYNVHWTDQTNFVAVTAATPNGFCAWGERKSEGE